MDMKTPELPNVVDPDDLDDKNSATEGAHFSTLVQARIRRRDVIRGVLGLAAMAGGAGALSFSAVGDAAAQPVTNPNGRKQATSLDFDPVAKSIADELRVAAGYTATVIYATGDPLTSAVPDYAGDGSEDRYDLRCGDHHDGMNYFGLHPTLDVRDSTSTTRAVLAVNHENITGTAQFLHPLGETNNFSGAGPRPESEVIKEQDAHGVSFVELRKVSGQWKTHKPSRYNHRITARTVVDISGPVRGTDWVKTKFSPDGLTTRGTLNNCGHGVTPWGTYLTCEENWAGYFKRNAGDDALRSQRENTQLLRNGIRPNSEGFAHRR
jgi:hypothetical protein